VLNKARKQAHTGSGMVQQEAETPATQNLFLLHPTSSTINPTGEYNSNIFFLSKTAT
jgi:hypothetical protein